MVASRDGSAGTFRCADRPVLVEGRSANDGRLINALAPVDVVSPSITSNAAQHRCASGRIIRAVVFDNIVLNKRVFGPAVDG